MPAQTNKPARRMEHRGTIGQTHHTSPAARADHRRVRRQPSSQGRFAQRPIAYAVSVTMCGIALAVADPQSAQAQTPSAAQTAQSPSQRSAAARQSYSIPAGPLAPALRSLASTANVLLTFTADQTNGKTTAGVSGQYAPEEALAALLAGTGLQALQLDNGGYVLTVVPVVSATARDVEATLPVVTVKASADTKHTGLATEGYPVTNSNIAGFTERPIKDTPFSVNVIPTELMLNQGASDLGKLSQMDASVSESYGNWYPGPFIRGFDASSTDNYRRNGMAFNHLYTPGLENKERVEILKGLSGLQAGFSSPGGAINYVTKRPEEISDLHVSANQFGNAKAHVDVGRMVTEDFGYRLNVAMEEQRNHIDKVEGPRHFIAGAVSWRITPDTYFDFDVEHERRSKTFQPALTLNADGKIPAMPSPSTFYGQNWAKFGIDATTTSGRLQQKLGQDWSVSIAMMHQDLKRENNWLGFDSITQSGDAVVNLWRNPNEKFSVNSLQLTAQGRFETAGARHDLAFGYEDSHRRTDGRGSTWVGAFGSTNIYNPVALPQPSDTNDAGSLMKQRRSGFFLNDVIALGEMWDIHVGGRYVQVKDKTYDFDILTSTYEKTAFAPTAAFVFKPRHDLSAYLSYTEGLEAGGTAPIGTTNANEVMAPLVSKQLETGLKGEIGQLAWAASVFRISKPAEYTNSANAYVQTGEQLHQGLELAVSGKLTKEVTLFGSTMWLDARMKETGDPTTTGKRPTGVTKQRVSMSVEYTPTALLGWSFAANWTHSGDRAVNATNTAVAPGYDIFSMGLRHQRKIMGRDVTFRLNVDNVFDKRYWANAKNSYLEVGAPRTVSGSLSMAF